MVGGSLWVLWIPLPIKLTTMIKLKYCFKMAATTVPHYKTQIRKAVRFYLNS
jgi:hypothetical protein